MRQSPRRRHNLRCAARSRISRERVSGHENCARPTGSSWKEALRTIEQQDSVHVSFSTYASLLRGCYCSRSLSLGRRAHSMLAMLHLERDHYLGNLLLLVYCNCDAFVDSFSLFYGGISERNVFSWAIIIRACIHQGFPDKALQLFHQMLAEGIMPDTAVLATVLSACAQQEELCEAMKIHCGFLYSGLDKDTVIGTALVNTYSVCGKLQMARKTFDNMCGKNVVSWTAMVAAYWHHGHASDALILFEAMQSSSVVPNEVTYLTLINVCASDGLLAECKLLHASIVERCCFSDFQTNNALINAYGECGSLCDANSVLSKMVYKDVVSWTSAISACVHHGACQTAQLYFQQMQLEGFLPDRAAFVSMVDAWTEDGAFVEGIKVHLQAECSALELDVVIGTALINMYGRFGKLGLAERIFHSMPVRNVLTWNSIVATHAHHGDFQKAFHYFRQMERDGIMPDISTLSSILNACAHAGLVDEGLNFALNMHEIYSVEPTVEHLNCFVGLLSRLGLITGGKTLVGSMPMQPTASSWVPLLSGCKVHIDLKQGECAAYHAFETSAERKETFIVLSDLCIAAASLAV